MSPRAVLARSSIRNGQRPLLEYGRIDLDALLESRLKPRLGPAAEAAVRRQFTDRAEPRVYSRLFGARNRSLLSDSCSPATVRLFQIDPSEPLRPRQRQPQPRP